MTLRGQIFSAYKESQKNLKFVHVEPKLDLFSIVTTISTSISKFWQLADHDLWGSNKNLLLLIQRNHKALSLKSNEQCIHVENV